SITEQTTSTLVKVRETIAATAALDAQLTCALGLARVEPNPALVAAVLARSLPALRIAARERRWPDVTRWMARFGELAVCLEPPRRDVAKAIREALGALCDRALIVALAQLGAAEAGHAHAAAIVAALGSAIVPAWLALHDEPATRTAARQIASLM